MGACLSCLSGNEDEDEATFDETSPLLPDEDQQKQQEEEMHMELRNKELNNILNSTNDHLIDMSTYKQAQLGQQQQQQQQQYQNTVGSTASLQSQPQPAQPAQPAQPQYITDMSGSVAISHVASANQQYQSVPEVLKVEPVDQPRAEAAVKADLHALSERLGSKRLQRLVAIDTSNVGPLTATLD